MGIRVIGIGNRLRGDDSVGPVVVDSVRERFAVDAIEHSGESLSLMDAWSEADPVVLVDAVRSGAGAGRIHRIDLIGEPLDVSSWTFSTHAFSLAETLELGRTLGRLPRRMIFYGVEGLRFEIGAPMTEDVAAAVPKVVEEIEREIAEARHA